MLVIKEGQLFHVSQQKMLPWKSLYLVILFQKDWKSERIRLQIIVEMNMICKDRKAQTSQKQNQGWKTAQVQIKELRFSNSPFCEVQLC